MAPVGKCLKLSGQGGKWKSIWTATLAQLCLNRFEFGNPLDKRGIGRLSATPHVPSKVTGREFKRQTCAFHNFSPLSIIGPNVGFILVQV